MNTNKVDTNRVDTNDSTRSVSDDNKVYANTIIIALDDVPTKESIHLPESILATELPTETRDKILADTNTIVVSELSERSTKAIDRMFKDVKPVTVKIASKRRDGLMTILFFINELSMVYNQTYSIVVSS